MKKNDNLKKRSQNLRRDATKEENTLWYQYLRKYKVQFRRQCPIGPYIVDFYCAKALLVIELDGSQHYDPQRMAKDAKRTRYLESLGIAVLRFSNSDVNHQLRGVCEKIDLVVRQRYQALPSQGLGRAAFTTKINRGIDPSSAPSGHLPPKGKV